MLVDAGLSRREIAKRLAAIGEDVHRLDAILVTHEHSDHVAGLGSMARALRIPIYLTQRTAPFIDWGEPELAAKRIATIESFQAGCGFTVGEFDISTFTIPHDAADPIGYTLRAKGIRVSIATDLGYMPDSIRVHLRGTDVLLLESNYDLEMLKVGPYPWSVKQRVMGRRGHLSNEVAGEFLRESLDSTVSTVILGHISEHNNHPELVRRMAIRSLKGRLLFTKIVVAEPGCQSEVVAY